MEELEFVTYIYYLCNPIGEIVLDQWGFILYIRNIRFKIKQYIALIVWQKLLYLNNKLIHPP